MGEPLMRYNDWLCAISVVWLAFLVLTVLYVLLTHWRLPPWRLSLCLWTWCRTNRAARRVGLADLSAER